MARSLPVIVSPLEVTRLSLARIELDRQHDDAAQALVEGASRPIQTGPIEPGKGAGVDVYG
ncbi:MAG: hypothetical protein AAFZ87_02215 [Planctomycetota bacterium]